eukprot:3955320-Amphidinium_carterae.1
MRNVPTLLSKLVILVSVAVRKWRTLSILSSTVRIGTKKGVKPAYLRLPVAPACVRRLHGLLPAPPLGLLPAHEPPLVMKAGVHTVWTDGSGRH